MAGMSRSLTGAVAVAISVVAAGFLWWPAPAGPPVVEVAAPRIALDSITVHVSGRVASPGLVALPHGSRVADAVLAAGGALPGADLAALNLAAPLVDGQHLVVGAIGPDGVPAASPGDTRVRVNTADAASLDSLPGVGPVLAARIVAYREANGPFETVEDLLDVPGIGESKLAAMRDAVLVP